MMTVESSKYMDLVNNENESFVESNREHNNENIYPLSGELMVAIRPLISNCNIPLISKLHFTKTKAPGEKVEKDVLSANLNNLSSPVKRTLNLPSPKKTNKKIAINSSLTVTTCLTTTASITASLSTQLTKHFTSAPALLQQLSHSADSTNLQTALKHVQDNLSQSCFAELTSERKSSHIDSELTCLNWLQEANLLKDFTSTPAKKTDSTEDDTSDNKVPACSQDFKLDSKDPLSAINDVDKSLRKPAYSFSTLIFMAIESSPSKRLPVKDIYQWIQDNFPYFQRAPIGWKNSIRHNLSLNKSFKKVDKEKCIGKGSLWTIDHQARAGLVNQLRKTSMCNSYPYSKPPQYPNMANGMARYFLKDKKLHRRDDAEFDVAAAMCSLSSTALIDYQNDGTVNNRFDSVSSEELLQIWRTCIEPNDDLDEPTVAESFTPNQKSGYNSCKYSIKDFIDEVQNKLSYKSRHNTSFKSDTTLDTSLNISMDEDYEFDKSDDDSSDEEMRENMRRLVDKENDECLGDSGYSEEGTLKTATMLDHSYSKSIQSLVRPHSKREVKGVDALLHLANAATRELENLTNSRKQLQLQKLRCSESSPVQFTAEKSCQYNSPAAVTMS